MRRAALIIAAFGVLLAVVPARAELGLADTDRVMFFSSTPLWPASFGMRVETFVRVRYPALKARFWHWAPPRDASIDLAKQRIDEYLAAWRPTMVVLNFGLEHGQWRSLRASRLGSFRADLLGLIDRCRKIGARVVLVTPNSPEIAQKTRLTRAKYDEAVAAYARTVGEVGQLRQLTVVDWFAVTAEQVGQAGTGSAAATPLTTDGLKPTPLSNAIGAELFLQAIGAQPLEIGYQLDWGSLEASTTAGGTATSIRATRQSDAVVSVDFHGLPIPWAVAGRGRIVELNRIGSPMCRLTLQLVSVPPGGVLICRPGGQPRGYSQRAVDGGIDLLSIAAVAKAKPVADLVELVKRKNMALDRYQRFLREPLRAAEYAEVNRKYLEALLSEANATDSIIDRTPRAMDLTLEIRLAGAPGQ